MVDIVHRDEDFRKARWSGQEFAPDLMDQTATEALRRGDTYEHVLTLLRRGSQHGFLMTRALNAACTQWPWSIDLHLMALVQTRQHRLDESTQINALRRLETCVHSQKRRYAALANSLWDMGKPDQALDALANLSPEQPSFGHDRWVRASLCLRAGLEFEPFPDGPEKDELRLRQTYAQDGPKALSAAMNALSEPLTPGGQIWLVESFLGENDFTQAEACLKALENAPETAQIRLALERQDFELAQSLLTRQPLFEKPWLWSAQRLFQHLRAEVGLARKSVQSSFTRLADFAKAARRVYPLHEGLQRLHLTLREETEDWDDLSAQMRTGELSDLMPPEDRAQALARYGEHAEALRLLDNAPKAIAPEYARFRCLVGAQIALHLGDLDDAETRLGPAPTLWPARADHAYWAAEIALSRRQMNKATHILAPVLSQSPTRMGHHLSAARCAMFQGSISKAHDYLTIFRQAKTAQIGCEPPPDLRDFVVEEARTGGQETVAQAIRTWLTTPPKFAPVASSNIPLQIAHYWEGPRSAPVERGIRAWSRQHPRFNQRVFDAQSAQDWLNAHAPQSAHVFAALGTPAVRADLFRIAWLAECGGVFTDLDEYPRGPIADWLDGATAVFVVEYGQGTIANNFISIEPKHQVMSELLARVLERLKQTETPYAWWDSGPAQMTKALAAWIDKTPRPEGLRLLTQAAYDARVATNLPFPHKRRPDHWRR